MSRDLAAFGGGSGNSGCNPGLAFLHTDQTDDCPGCEIHVPLSGVYVQAFSNLGDAHPLNLWPVTFSLLVPLPTRSAPT